MMLHDLPKEEQQEILDILKSLNLIMQGPMTAMRELLLAADEMGFPQNLILQAFIHGSCMIIADLGTAKEAERQEQIDEQFVSVFKETMKLAREQLQAKDQKAN